jgi:hypothetical protein
MAVLMIMTAMFIVMMAVGVVVTMTVMIIRRMFVTCVVMGLPRRVAVTGISATLGVEGCFDFENARAQSPHHCLDDVVAADT